ncbi:MAG: signal peptidase II [Chloroflexi bacterium]|nr:signal peptidase II [Chloroflexota bacterium]MDL1942947.1 signal peptidase II [Chloroflexi bacterium CFX2]
MSDVNLQEKDQPRRGRFFILLFVAGALVALDQWTKWLVRRNIPLNTDWLPEALEWLAPYARLRHIQNSGVSFGMFQDGNTILTVLVLLVVAGILYYISRMESENIWMWTAAGLYLGGAVGNLIDRLTLGGVTDFVSVGNFYIFNLADASINISVAMLLVLFWLAERKPSEHSESKNPEGNP